MPVRPGCTRKDEKVFFRGNWGRGANDLLG